jgi:tRNA U34 5-methylaminomethyl-2-thiouridine-forming methyltransferase MnmC
MEDIFINKHYNDCYFSKEGGYNESRYVFIDGNNLGDRDLNNIKIGETGFGTGLNFLVLEDLILEKSNFNIEVTFTTVEKYPLSPDKIYSIFSDLGLPPTKITDYLDFYNKIYPFLKLGWHHFEIKREWGVLNFNIFIGDVLDSFVDYPVLNDCWFLDGHSPLKNPEMWSKEVLSFIAKNTIEGGSLSTFTSSGTVKTGLREAGFFIRRKKGFGVKRHMVFGLYKS